MDLKPIEWATGEKSRGTINIWLCPTGTIEVREDFAGFGSRQVKVCLDECPEVEDSLGKVDSSIPLDFIIARLATKIMTLGGLCIVSDRIISYTFEDSLHAQMQHDLMKEVQAITATPVFLPFAPKDMIVYASHGGSMVNDPRHDSMCQDIVARYNEKLKGMSLRYDRKRTFSTPGAFAFSERVAFRVKK
jgi:hypothetical protein